MQSVSSRIWTRVAVFISYDDNNYTTGTSEEDILLSYSVKEKNDYDNLLGVKIMIFKL